MGPRAVGPTVGLVLQTGLWTGEQERALQLLLGLLSSHFLWKEHFRMLQSLWWCLGKALDWHRAARKVSVRPRVWMERFCGPGPRPGSREAEVNRIETRPQPASETGRLCTPTHKLTNKVA